MTCPNNACNSNKLRRTRRDLKTYAIAQRLAFTGESVGPRARCAVCARRLADPPSVARGVGPECWQGVLQAMEGER